MNYTKSLPSGKLLRMRFAQITSLTELENLAEEYLAHRERNAHELHDMTESAAVTFTVGQDPLA